MEDKMILNFMTDTELVSLYTEDGDEIVCEILKRFQVRGEDYAAIKPVEADELVEDGIYICRYYEEEDGSFELEDIDDEEELQEAWDTFEQYAKIDNL